MMEQFQKCGLGNEIHKMRNFESLMSAMGTWDQSVWELKRFTRLSQPYPQRAVFVDYGFINCQTPVELLSLREAYTKIFNKGADEMALHQACIQNRLSSFLRSELGSLSFDPALLESPYPLDGCNYMGIIVENGILCPESVSGDEGVILTHPDEVDRAVGAAFEDRAAFLK
ncbi:hypothetical protein BJX62DRAFT_228554 [Aspergillus germanicus]